MGRRAASGEGSSRAVCQSCHVGVVVLCGQMRVVVTVAHWVVVVLYCTGCARRTFVLMFGRARSGGSVVSWVVVRYVVSMIRQSNAVWLWRACCEHCAGRVASCVPEGVVMRRSSVRRTIRVRRVEPTRRVEATNETRRCCGASRCRADGRGEKTRGALSKYVRISGARTARPGVRCGLTARSET